MAYGSRPRFEMDHTYTILGSVLESLLIESYDKLSSDGSINRAQIAERIGALLSNAEDMTEEYNDKYGWRD